MKKRVYIALVLMFAAIALIEAWYIWSHQAPRQTVPVSVKPDAVDLSKVLVTQDLAPGTGPKAKNGDTVTITYIAKLLDGTVVQDLMSNGKSASFVIGAPETGGGFNIGLVGMQKGGRRTVSVPPVYSYPSSVISAGRVPKDATVIFDITVLGLESK